MARKLCRFGDRCPYLVTNKCQFAHSVDELEYWKRVRLDAMVDGRDELGYVAGGYGEPAGLGLSAASLPYDGGSPYA